MTWFWRTLTSSIGKKLVLGLAGLGLCGYLITHLLGVLFTFGGQETLDGYAALLKENILLIPAELFLLSLFGVHVTMAIWVTLDNRKSRPRGYAVRNDLGARTVSSSTMFLTGLATVFFVGLHVYLLRWTEPVDGSLFKLMVKTFRENFLFVAIHVIAVFLLAFHLSHGFQSALRTLGLNHPRFNPFVRLAGYGFGILIAVGFSSVPLYLYFIPGEGP
jgi:succinate dehydrogenase / fumarate reductase cytochrome b subunit